MNTNELTVAEIAELFGVSRRRVVALLHRRNELRAKARLPLIGRRVGRSRVWVVRDDEVDLLRPGPPGRQAR